MWEGNVKVSVCSQGVPNPGGGGTPILGPAIRLSFPPPRNRTSDRVVPAPHCIRRGRYTSCGHTGGLSCLNLNPITFMLSTTASFLVMFCFLFQVDSDFRCISLGELDYFGLYILCLHVFTCYYCCGKWVFQMFVNKQRKFLLADKRQNTHVTFCTCCSLYLCYSYSTLCHPCRKF